MLGGADVLTLNSLAGTDAVTVSADLAVGGGSAAADGLGDTVVLNGTSNGSNMSAMDLPGGGTQITGSSPTIVVTNADASDKIHANLFGGLDNLTVTQTGTSGSIRRIEVDGGTEQDTINVQRTAADGVVVVIPMRARQHQRDCLQSGGRPNVLFESSRGSARQCRAGWDREDRAGRREGAHHHFDQYLTGRQARYDRQRGHRRLQARLNSTWGKSRLRSSADTTTVRGTASPASSAPPPRASRISPSVTPKPARSSMRFLQTSLAPTWTTVRFCCVALARR